MSNAQNSSSTLRLSNDEIELESLFLHLNQMYHCTNVKYNKFIVIEFKLCIKYKSSCVNKSNKNIQTSNRNTKHL